MNWPTLTVYILVVVLLFSWLLEGRDRRMRNISSLAAVLIVGCALIFFACCTPSKKAPKKEKQEHEWGLFYQYKTEL